MNRKAPHERKLSQGKNATRENPKAKPKPHNRAICTVPVMRFVAFRPCDLYFRCYAVGMVYLQRAVDAVLARYIEELPALSIVGPRAVGKTETAKRLAKTFYRVDREDERALLQANPERICDDLQPVLLDEWQRFPSLIDVVRRDVDQDYSPGRYLLTGSVMPRHKDGTHTGAGRITLVRMRPMTLFEREPQNTEVSFAALLSQNVTDAELGQTTPWQPYDYMLAICASGFPQITKLSPDLATTQLESYLQSIIDQDAPDSNYHLRRPEALMAWMRAYAAASATSTGYNEILKAATPAEANKPSRNSTNAYREFLTQIWILDPLPAWDTTFNPLTRLAKSPKHYLADPGLAATLLNLDADTLYDDPVMSGRLFESLAALTMRVIGQNLGLRAYHLRTQNGDHEIDIILRGTGKKLVAIEVKNQISVKDADCKHLQWFEAKAPQPLSAKIVLYAGKTAYRRKDGTYVIPLRLLGL
ncbi:ATP-binding protein [Mobiluncus mulieris]|nr:DUF4143 domain-containing protein [Mobiluncus mulieris]MCU9997307.1 ATP-binding protein [Mobiluncus mulieris]